MRKKALYLTELPRKDSKEESYTNYLVCRLLTSGFDCFNLMTNDVSISQIINSYVLREGSDFLFAHNKITPNRIRLLLST